MHWFKQKGYAQGVFFITCVALNSNLNDIIMRSCGRLPAIEVTFFRYFFATLSLLLLAGVRPNLSLKSTHLILHFVRAVLLCGAIFCWSYAVTVVPLALMSAFALTVPLFVLPMASLFLKERVGLSRYIATITGFIGILIIVLSRPESQLDHPTLVDITQVDGLQSRLTLMLQTLIASFDLNNGVILLILAAILFAASDVINKKYISKESTLSMMFYIALFTCLLSAVPLITSGGLWTAPSIREMVFLCLLGIGGNSILFFLLRAFAATDVSALAPYRYTELIFAIFFGYFWYRESLSEMVIIGIGTIVVSTALISWYENKSPAPAPASASSH